MHDEHAALAGAFGASAANPAMGARVDDIIKQAKGAGVSILAIIQAILAHAGDLQAIYDAIKALIDKLHPKTP